MRSSFFTVILLAAVPLLSDYRVTAQDRIGLNCPPTASAQGQDEAVRAATRQYLTALQAKDWEAASKLSVTLFTGFNLTQGLMQDLLQPLKIESLSFEIHETSVKPCEASVRYTMSLRAVDPQTQKSAVDVAGLSRVARWRRFECSCPPQNVTEWWLERDAADAGELASAVAAAKTPEEQRLLLLAQDDNELKELAGVLARRGSELLKRGLDAQASAMFGLNRAVLGQVKHHARVRILQQAGGLDGMLAEARKGSDRSAQGRLLNSLGQVYMSLGERGRAVQFFEESLKFQEAGAEVAANSYLNIAVSHRNRGEYARAVDYFQKSLGLYRQVAAKGQSDAESVADNLLDVLFNLAFLHEAMGREDLARDSYREFANNVEKGSELEALLLVLLGSVKTVKGNVTEAVEYLERASSILARGTSEDKAVFITITSSLLVEPYLRRNDYARAAAHLARAREALKGAKPGEISDGFILLIESMLYGSQGDKQLAASRTRLGLSNVTGQILKGAGGEAAGAGINHEEDSDIAFLPNLLALNAVGNILGSVLEDKGGGDEVYSVPLVLNAVALEHLLRGGKENLEAALKLFFRVLDEAAGDELLIALTHERIAGVYRRLKNYPEALNYYYKSLKLMESAGLPLTLRLTEFEPSNIIAWRNIARIHAAAGDYEQALSDYQKILGRSPRFYRLLDTTLLYEVAEINFKLGRYDDALGSIGKALTAASGGGDRDVLWKLHTLAGKSERALKRDAAAADSFAEAIRAVEASRSEVVGGSRLKERFFEDKLAPYHAMIAMLIEQGKCEEALAYAERSKSRVLLDALSHGNLDVSRTPTAAELEQERTLRGRMIAADREFSAAQVKSQDSPLSSQLREKRLEARLDYEAFRVGLWLPGGARHGTPAEVVGPADIAALLPAAGGALLEFAVTDEKTYLFVLTEGGDKVRGNHRATPPPPLCKVHSIALGADELNRRLVEINRRIANPQGIVQLVARELFDLLLKPAWAELTGRTTLTVVPDRGLWRLPFQALQPSAGRYLLQESAVYYAPSLTSLREMRKARTKGTARTPGEKPTLLVMANPAGDSAPLLLTEAQAPRLAQLYGPERSKVYARADADEGRFKKEAQGFDVIHLGAHGLFDDDDPMHSRILLSTAKARADRASSADEDGVLEAWEIMDLELKANLAVLSACETARGRVGDGEGIVGLTWALFMAGVPSTVVSQWEVDEAATAELMYFFHENFVKGTTPDPARPRKAEALRQASLKLIGSEKYSHPYYWAGFGLIGDGN